MSAPRLLLESENDDGDRIYVPAAEADILAQPCVVEALRKARLDADPPLLFVIDGYQDVGGDMRTARRAWRGWPRIDDRIYLPELAGAGPWRVVRRVLVEDGKVTVVLSVSSFGQP